jgi:branched-chain amino acid transport system substrate-binding protein
MTNRLQKLLLGSCLALGLGASAPASAEELRIGYIAPVTGIFAQVGKDMVDGFQLYLDEHGGKLGGMDVKFIVEDDQGKPDAGVTKAKKLILQDKVHMFIGGLLASSGYALAPISTSEKTLYISSVSSADDLTQRQLSKYPYFMRTSWTSSLPHHPLGQWACDNGFKKVIVIAADYAFGYETAGGFQSAFEACGGKVIQKIWPPLGTKDFGPYIPTFKAEFVLPFMGDEVIGDVSSLHYSAAIDTPANQAFVKAYRAKFGKVPGYYSENNYTTAMWLDKALTKTGGKYPGPEEFIKVMASIKLDAPRGPVELDDMRNPIENVYIKKVEKKKMFGYDKDELWNTVIKTYPKVSQFWTEGKEKFLAHPVYDRDYPPCKNCE